MSKHSLIHQINCFFFVLVKSSKISIIVTRTLFIVTRIRFIFRIKKLFVSNIFTLMYFRTPFRFNFNTIIVYIFGSSPNTNRLISMGIRIINMILFIPLNKFFITSCLSSTISFIIIFSSNSTSMFLYKLKSISTFNIFPFINIFRTNSTVECSIRN